MRLLPLLVLAILPLQAVAAEPALPSRAAILDPDSGYYRERGMDTPEGLRDRTLAEAARGVGIRAGYADEARRLDRLLSGDIAVRLDRRYDFIPLLLQGGTIVPPVVSAMNSVEETSGDGFLYTSVGAYEIVSDARVTIRAPSWRDYLVLPVSDPAPPGNLQPKTGDEKELWRHAAAEGWDRGVQEARDAWVAALDRLARDYAGMTRYRDLLRQGVLSEPRVQTRHGRWRATDDGRRAFLNETAIRITVMPKFSASKPGRNRP